MVKKLVFISQVTLILLDMWEGNVFTRVCQSVYRGWVVPYPPGLDSTQKEHGTRQKMTSCPWDKTPQKSMGPDMK